MDLKECIITIDPGKSGGVSVYANGKITAVKMPETVRRLYGYLRSITMTYKNPVVYIEKVQAYRGKTIEDLKETFDYICNQHPDPEDLYNYLQNYLSDGDNAPGKKFGINKMLKNYAEITTVVELLEVPMVEVYPVSWQSTLGLVFKGYTKTQRKNEYKEFAQRSFPELGKITLAVADSVCLVQFVMHKLLHDPVWIQSRIQQPVKSGLF